MRKGTAGGSTKPSHKAPQGLDLRKVGNSVLLVSHECPDLDSLASSVALKRLLTSGGDGRKRSVIISVKGGLNERTRRVLRLLGERVTERKPTCKVDTLIVVDTSSRLAVEEFVPLASHRILIDHHAVKKGHLSLFDQYLADDRFTSCAEIVYGLLKDSGFKPDRRLSLALSAAIVTDTANLIAAKAETLETLGEIMAAAGLEFKDIVNLISTPIDVSEKIARLEGAKRMEFHRIGKHIIAVSRVSAYEASVAHALLHLGADIAFVGAKNKGKVRICARCKPWLTERGYHLGKKVLPEIEGLIEGDAGGHAAAGGATGDKVRSLDQALSECVRISKEFLKRADA